ncbi:MAG: flagellar basal body L-ring protein FlgH [Candidatus Krumholzibacteriia bacterium]
MPLMLAIALCALLVGAAAPARAAEPLIDLDSGASLVTNQKARVLGDVVTILIVERTSASTTSKTDGNEKSEVSGGPGLGFLDFIPSWGFESESKYKGDGKTQRSGDLRAEISARVVEVLHNGDYRLEGSRMVKINGESQLIEITGICRPRDIRADNTILSTFISDAQIAYTGAGTVHSAGEPGIVTKIVHWLF